MRADAGAASLRPLRKSQEKSQKPGLRYILAAGPMPTNARLQIHCVSGLEVSNLNYRTPGGKFNFQQLQGYREK